MAVGGNIIRADVELTRPANATAYTNGDVISDNATTTTLLVFPLASIGGGSGYIISASVWADQKACVGVLRLKLFTASTATVAADNAANTVIYANAASYVDSIDFPALAEGVDTTNSTGAKAINDAIRIPFTCAAANSNLYGVLEVTAAAFTPASGQKFHVTLVADAN